MAKMQLFVDWEDEGETAGWQAEAQIPLERFQFDDRYAAFLSDYISRGLEYLAKEVELIGQQYGRHLEMEDGCD